MGEDTLERLCKEAFPIIVYIRKDGDNVRRIKEITESYLDENGKWQIQTLYEYVIVKNEEDENGRLKIDGHFRKVSSISESLRLNLINRNITEDLLKLF